MRYFTAQCAADLICVAVTDTPGPLTAPPGKTFISLGSYDLSVIGKRWNPQTLQFEAVNP